MGSQEAIAVAEISPRFQPEKSFEAKSVDLLGSMQKFEYPDRALTRRKLRVPKIKQGVSYNMTTKDGERVGVVVLGPSGKVNDFSMWFTHVGKGKNEGRMQNLVYAPGEAAWFDSLTKACCGGFCVNSAHNKNLQFFRLERRRAHHAVGDTVRTLARYAGKVLKKGK